MKKSFATRRTIIFFLLLGTTSCSILRPGEPAPVDLSGGVDRDRQQPVQILNASYYGFGDGFSGKPTASGEKFDPERLTAAHRHLPFGTKLRVKNIRTGRSVLVRVNDRGPFIAGRGIDLSYGAAKQIGLLDKGVDKVEIQIVNESAPE